MKKYFSLAVIFFIFTLFAFYFSKNQDLILATFHTTAANMTRYFFAALALVIVSFFFLSRSYQVVFKMNGISRSTWNLFKMNLAGTAVNVVVPSAGLSQALVYAEDAKRRGDSRSATVNSVIVTYISDYSSICLFLIFSLIYLAVIKSLMPHVIVPAVLFFLLTVGVYLLAYFAGRESRTLENIILKIAGSLERVVSLFTKKKINIKESADKLYHDFREVNKAIIKDPKDWFLAILYACLFHLFAIFAFYVIFISFGYQPVIRVLVAAYSVGAAFVVVSPTPNGIGFVEGGMFLVLTSLGVPAPLATTALIIYRGLTFWIPLFFGFIIYQRMKIKDIIDVSPEK